ncbi:MAG TPA: hypothetical protein VH436_30355 [Vicinamibacterales bacterium]
MSVGRSRVVTEGLVESLKYTVQRPRPDGSSGYSFPSGHAAVTFATATVLDRHHSWRVSQPAYAFATYVATAPRTSHWFRRRRGMALMFVRTPRTSADVDR